MRIAPAEGGITFDVKLKGKWRRSGSNRQPPPCKGGALPIELRPHFENGSAGGRIELRAFSGRTWIRTKDLVVISDAL